MTLNLTGHAEIDLQHELLDSTVGRLAFFCSESAHRPDASCNQCDAVKQKHCRTVLASISDELTAFLAGHSAYEEKMMELLPETPNCQNHVTAHKAAHEGIAKQLKKISMQTASENPRDVGAVIMRVVGDWLSDHCTLFDTRLVDLGKPNLPKIDFDSELVKMLDQHVFPNRPTKLKASAGNTEELREKKLAVRGRFESLSPAQGQVFRLVVSGKTNPEISNTLGISVNTVKTHRAAIFQKMDVSSVLELVKKVDLLR